MPEGTPPSTVAARRDQQAADGCPYCAQGCTCGNKCTCERRVQSTVEAWQGFLVAGGEGGAVAADGASALGSPPVGKLGGYHGNQYLCCAAAGGPSCTCEVCPGAQAKYATHSQREASGGRGEVGRCGAQHGFDPACW